MLAPKNKVHIHCSSYLVVNVAVAGVAPNGEIGIAEHKTMLCLQPVHQHVLVYEPTAVYLQRHRNIVENVGLHKVMYLYKNNLF